MLRKVNQYAASVLQGAIVAKGDVQTAINSAKSRFFDSANKFHKDKASIEHALTVLYSAAVRTTRPHK